MFPGSRGQLRKISGHSISNVSFVTDYMGEAERQTFIDRRHQHPLDRQSIRRDAFEHRLVTSHTSSDGPGRRLVRVPGTATPTHHPPAKASPFAGTPTSAASRRAYHFLAHKTRRPMSWIYAEQFCADFYETFLSRTKQCCKPLCFVDVDKTWRFKTRLPKMRSAVYFVFRSTLGPWRTFGWCIENVTGNVRIEQCRDSDNRCLRSGPYIYNRSIATSVWGLFC